MVLALFSSAAPASLACVPSGPPTSGILAPLDGGLHGDDDATPSTTGEDAAALDAEPNTSLDAGADASAAPDARVHSDASVPDVGGCHGALPPGGGTTGPVQILQEQNHGLPGCYRCGLQAADFDGDGRIDVVMAGAFDSAFTPDMGNYTYQNRVRVFRNISCPGEEIRFELAGEMPNTVGGGGALVVTGDFDGDGKIDFAVQFREGESPASDTAAFLNMGGFNFTKQRVGAFDTESTSLGMAAGDFDRDGKDDLVFNSDAYGMAPGLWYRWNGSAFEARQTDFEHHITYGGTIAAGDLDGDGFADIAVGGNSRQPFGTYDCASTLLYGELHFNAGMNNPAVERAGTPLSGFAMRADPAHPAVCEGMDNAAMMFADMDGDGTLDVVVAGSTSSFPGPPPGPPMSNGSQYDFVVLFNRDGTGRNFVAWENAGTQYPNGTTNGGSGNLDSPNMAVGDLDGDGFPDAFIQGHHRDYGGDVGSYVFDTRLYLNVAGMSFMELELGLPDVGEGGQAMADFNNDGKIDLLFAGASLPFHSNGNNPTDRNNATTIFAYVYRNVRP